MSVKAPAGLTHRTRLYQPERWLNQIAAGLERLAPRLGVLLVQLPPNQPCDLPRLAYFLERAPSWLRLALEFRHPSWHQEAVFTLLAQHQAAYCVMSGPGCPVSCELRLRLCMSACTAPTPNTFTPAPTLTMIYAGGPTAAANGRGWGWTCLPTSTTTPPVMPSVTRRR